MQENVLERYRELATELRTVESDIQRLEERRAELEFLMRTYYDINLDHKT